MESILLNLLNDCFKTQKKLNRLDQRGRRALKKKISVIMQYNK